MTIPLVYVLYRGFSVDREVWDRLLDDRLLELLWSTAKLAIAVSIVTAVTGSGPGRS